jgi:hypothetical protein
LSRTLRITAPAKSASSVRWSSGGRRSRGDVLGDDDELTEEVFILQIAKPVALVAKIYVGGEVKGRAEPAPLLS